MQANVDLLASLGWTYIGGSQNKGMSRFWTGGQISWVATATYNLQNVRPLLYVGTLHPLLGLQLPEGGLLCNECLETRAATLPH